ncbi:MAG: hypothetical protein BGO57_14385 [Sphingomonadales bacterium 63-6]|nr:MAG: hypothetical protein BGO57_14385 [Sphingomonadales bacterium 63-6]
MAYVDRQSATSKATSIFAVGLIHAGLGAALIYGLAATFIPKAEDGPLISNDFPLPKTPPPPPSDMPSAAPSSTISTVNPPIDTKQNEEIYADPRPFPTSSEVARDPMPYPTIAPTIPGTPTPPPLFTPKNPSPANDRANWVTTADYPARDLRLGHTGTTKYRVVISSSGKVQSCEITGSSGYAGLDEATCKGVSRRARFDPAINANGEKIVGTWSGSVSWRIPD